MKRKLPLVLMLAAALAVMTSTSHAAKRKGAGGVDVTKPVNALVPDRVDSGLPGPLTTPVNPLNSTIAVGKRFKGRRIRDVNVTLQTTGATGTTPAEDLSAQLRAPNGATSELFGFLGGPGLGLAFPSIGPLTLDDEAALFIPVFSGGSPVDPTTIYPPYAGRAHPAIIPLAPMDGGPVRGNWVLSVYDAIPGETSVLNSWRLEVTAGKPFVTK
jgi:hypothetical protein